MREAGLSYWFDEQHALPNKEPIGEISRGLERSDYLIVFIDRAADSSGWVLSELSSRIHSANSYLLILVDYPLQEWLRDRPAVLARQPIELSNGDARLIEQLTQIKMDSFRASLSFDESQSIQDEFNAWSRFGQGDAATIRGRHIKLPIVNEILGSLSEGVSVLIGGPGSGKSGTLRAVFEQWTGCKLFLKMDLLLDLDRWPNLEMLSSHAGRLATTQPVAIFIDSLDVLSSHRQVHRYKATLKLLDDLSYRANLLILIACREFDLNFDPILKERKWVKKFKLNNLDFVSQVVPLLDELGCASPAGDTLCHLLCVPQNLGLYVHLHQLYPDLKIATTHDLYNHYLEQVIGHKSELGPVAVNALESMARQLVETRKSSIARSNFDAIPSIQRLRSLNVLKAPNPDRIGFAHQSWQEFFAVRSAIRQGHSLLAFIVNQDQLPHCRAYIRSFFEHLARETDYLSQLRKALLSGKVTYHIKRLLVASLGRLEAPEQALALINVLTKEQPELIQALFKNLRTLSWLHLLTERWLEAAWNDGTKIQQVLWFLGNLDAFTDTAPEVVLRLTLRGLTEKPEIRGNLVFLSYRILTAAPIARLAESRKLMEWYLLNDSMNQLLDTYLADWLMQRGPEDDDLLWEFLQVSDKNNGPSTAGLRFSRQHFGFPDGFLAQRFSDGEFLKDQLLDLLDSIRPGDENFLTLDWRLLQSSSYKHRRHEGMAAHNCLDDILSAFETALILAAQQDTIWWSANHQRLWDSKLEVLGYLHLKAVTAAVDSQKHLAIARSKEVDSLEKHYGWEWVELLKAIYPQLSPDQMDDQQQLLLRHGNPAEIALAVKAIPACYRCPEAQLLLDGFDGLHKLPEHPATNSKSGFVKSPVSAEEFAKLSGAGIIRLLDYYQNSGYNPSDWESSSFIGSKQQFLQALNSATSTDPARFFHHISEFQNDPDVFWCVLGGLSDSMRLEAGRMNTGQPRKALSRLDCNCFFSYVMQLPLSNRRERRFLSLLKSCGETSLTLDNLNLLVTTILQLTDLEAPTVYAPFGTNLLTTEIDSCQIVAVECALTILTKQITSKMQVSLDLVKYLFKKCLEGNPAIHALVLGYVPEITGPEPEIGWALFELCEATAVEHGLWQAIEPIMRCRYRAEPQRVAQFLDKYIKQHRFQCGEMLGRQRALMVLAQIGDWEILLSQAASSAEIWNGAAEIFAKNLTEGLPFLVDLLVSSPAHASNSKLLDYWLFSQDNWTKIPSSLAKTYLKATSQRQRNRLETWRICRWLEWTSRSDPDKALELFFELDQFVDWESESAAKLLMVLLREVDDRNDPDFTQAVLRVQDLLERQQPGLLDKLEGD